jgi:membrane-associated phospholipid phosphatase
MTTTEVDSASSPDGQPPDTERPRWLGRLRIALIVCWCAGLTTEIVVSGISTNQVLILAWPLSGAAVWCIGKRRPWEVVLDFLPLIAILVAWSYLRGFADSLGMPTWWHPQLRIEKWLFFGNVPTLWLQEHLKAATPQWWEVPVALTYLSFFFVPGATAAVLWVRKRRDFYRWSTRYVVLSFSCYVVFALAPTAPPWAAARCTARHIVNHPSAPHCMTSGHLLDTGGLLGLAAHPQPGAMPWVERISVRSLSEIHLDKAKIFVDSGRVLFDPVASMPSLHAATTVLFAIFMWQRVRRAVRAVLVLYPLMMGFALVYAGDHYVIDVLAGWAAAAVVAFVVTRIERRWFTPSEPAAIEAS